MNTVWQPAYISKDEMNIAAQTEKSIYLGTVLPGVYDPNANPAAIDPFDNQHTLQRLRGVCLHEVYGNSGQDSLVHVNTAAFKVPVAVAGHITSDADMPNLFQSGDGEDYPYFMSHVCGTGRSSPTSNVDAIDNKAKRRFDPGDALVFSASYYNSSTETTLDLYIGLNLRFLWSLIGR